MIPKKHIPKKIISDSELYKLTPKTIAIQLLKCMKKHIGKHNAVNGEDLFYEVFRHAYQDKFGDWFRYSMLKQAISFCRHHTRCFIGVYNDTGIWKYFVLQTEEDYSLYADVLYSYIKNLKRSLKRAKKSINDQWHTIDWVADIKRLE